MFKKIKLINLLKTVDVPVCLLPDGFYSSYDNTYLKDSNQIIDEFKSYALGSLFRVQKENLSYRNISWNKIFKQEFPYKTEPFKSINYRELTYDYLLKEIEQYQYDLKRYPYENYLEVVIIHLILQSLTLGKSLLGGVWSSGVLLSNVHKKGRNTFAYFATNVQTKNDIIAQLKIKLEQYPTQYTDIVNKYKWKEFNEKNSQYGSLLEFRILQIRCKTILQEICLHSHYLTEQDKKKFDNEFKLINHLMSTFPIKT